MALSLCKKLSVLFRGITSTHNGNFYCINCLDTFRTKNKLKKHENVCKNHYYCNIEIKKDNKILEYNYVEKTITVRFLIYADIESLLERINTSHNNPEKSSTIKINSHAPRGYSLFTHCSFDAKKKSKPSSYRGKNKMIKFGKYLKEHLIIS